MTDPTTDALHAERLARLTALARRVWPDLTSARAETDPEWQAATVVYGDGERRVASVEAHPRALDALEAALLVLAGEGHISYSIAAPGLTEKLEALTAPHRQPAWVEQLASEMEAEAKQWLGEYRAAGDAEDSVCMLAAQQQLICAARLRERARKP